MQEGRAGSVVLTVDPRLTAITYNDANLMPVGDAISKLPSIKTNSNYSPIDSPKMFSGCQNVSKDDSQDLRKNLGKGSDSEAESPEKTAFGQRAKSRQWLLRLDSNQRPSG